MRNKMLIVDPIYFRGGSKVATELMLKDVCDINEKIHVLTVDGSSWQSEQFKTSRLFELPFLKNKTQGVLYFLKHACLLLQIFILQLRIGRVDVLLGASGPGVDLSIYGMKKLLGTTVIQLIHGPVARSRSLGRCLQMADHVFYLQSSKAQILDAIRAFDSSVHELDNRKFERFVNGLDPENYPSGVEASAEGVFWAASLLKWKGLDTLVSALKLFSDHARPSTTVCYIKPKSTIMAVSKIDESIQHIDWQERPENLDQLRANNHIFVSTSHNEPFGLSILEALAAGQCVVIPSDGAYWDQILTDSINCKKYQPNNEVELFTVLETLIANPGMSHKIASEGKSIASKYSADIVYARFRQIISFHLMGLQPLES